MTWIIINMPLSRSISVGKRCGDGHILCPDGISVNISFVILYQRFLRCHHWEEMGRGYTECILLFITAYESTIISN